jgi:hypothetical protein
MKRVRNYEKIYYFLISNRIHEIFIQSFSFNDGNAAWKKPDDEAVSIQNRNHCSLAQIQFQ